MIKIINLKQTQSPEELGKYMWLIKVHISQEAPTSTSGSSSLYSKYKKIKIIILPGDIVNKSFKLRKYGHLKKLKEKMNLLGKNI